MITSEDVISSIEMHLARTPDAELINYHVRLGFSDRAALDAYICSTDEYEAIQQDKSERIPALGDQWTERARMADERRQRLQSFGPRAFGVLVRGEQGRYFAVDPEDASVTTHLLNDGQYHPHETELLERLMPDDCTVLIVGAHIGVHAVALAGKCRKLIAIEANPNTYELLKLNVRLNNCFNVDIMNLAAGSRREFITFLLNRENSGGSKRMPLENRRYYTYDEPEEIVIETVPLDEVIDEKVDVVLMDIEGSELYALGGMQGLLSFARVLAIEFLPFAMKEVANASIEEFCSLITPHFRQMYVPSRSETIDSRDMADVLATMFACGEVHDLLYFTK